MLGFVLIVASVHFGSPCWLRKASSSTLRSENLFRTGLDGAVLPWKRSPTSSPSSTSSASFRDLYGWGLRHAHIYAKHTHMTSTPQVHTNTRHMHKQVQTHGIIFMLVGALINKIMMRNLSFNVISYCTTWANHWVLEFNLAMQILVSV